jgi:putative ABC transport system permease protein
MTGHVPRGARWLIERTAPHLADDVIGEMEEQWCAYEGHRLAAVARAYRLASSVAWHATWDRLRPIESPTPGRGVPSMWPITHDLRLAMRRWTSRPVLALTAILILAIGIGATTSIFSIVDAVLLRPLPWKDPDRLVTLFVERPEWRTDPVLVNSWNTGNVSWPIVKDLQQRSTAFESFGAWRAERPTLNGNENELVRTLQVTSSLLPMLGVTPVRGRTFTPQEDNASSDVVLVSHETWQRRFGGRDDILGQLVSLNETRFSIVGVLPPGFRFGIPEPVEFILPMGRVPERERHGGNHFVNGIGRLAAGVTIDQARQQADPWVAGTEGVDKKRARILPMDEDRRAESRRPLLLLLAGAGLLLVIAASNVAALLLGDASSRRQEIAVRAALGGARWQVARQLFSEGLVLAIASAAAGLVIALILTPALVSMAPAALPVFGDIGIDARVFAFALGLTMVTLLFFGVAPSMMMSSADPAEAMREGGRDPGARRTRGYRWIVASQVALTTVLLVGAGLLVETVRQKVSQPLGFDSDRLAVTSLRLPPVLGAAAIQRAARTQALVDRLSSMAGVQSAAATSTAPFSGSAGSSGFQIPRKKFAAPVSANRHIVTDRYFETLGQSVLKGRVFDSTDQPGAHAAVITDEFERVHFDGDALGRRFILNGDEHTVIGVLRAAKHKRYTDDPLVSFYVLSRQLPQWPTGTLIVRASGDPEALLPSMRRAILEAEPQASFITLETMTAMTRRSVAEEEYRARLAVAFGALAVMLSAIGLYGIVARSVSDRRREMGVRLALGAAPSAVRGLVFRQALGVVGVGLAVGVPAALVAGQSLKAVLYGVTPTSPLVIAGASAAIGVAACIAALGPALRAGRVDPVKALKAR